MSDAERRHVPVMAEEALRWLDVQPDGTYVDATAGAGGHSALIAARLRAGRLLALDRDPLAVRLATENLKNWPQASVHHANYGEMAQVLARAGIQEVDGVLIDAGVSSMQIDEAERGFSFQRPGPLDMRMDTTRGESAQQYLNRISEADLVEVLRRYGDVGPVRRIARAILQRRDDNRLATTTDLAEAVREGLSLGKGLPEETRPVFQAIRIAVNEELRWLEQGLQQAISVLKPGGRLVVITFHSGEDRIAKTVLREASRRRETLRADGRVAERQPPLLRLLTDKPVLPAPEEMRSNPRAKSAKLRAAERCAAGGK